MNRLTVHTADSQRIEEVIRSDQSPVGIDAKKTHVIIIRMLEEILLRIESIESRLSDIESDQ